MCGIAGIISLNGFQNQVKPLKNMCQSMQNRGPDDEGFLLYNDKAHIYLGDKSVKPKNENLSYLPENHIDTAQNTKSKLAFGFKRLSIIDLSYEAHQPMCDTSQRYWIIFNGEVYNYLDIKKELQNLNHHFYSNSDTEVVLKAYMQWGTLALQKFNGMFAFAIFDSLKKSIFMARDRVGIKPLYFVKTDDNFIFGSTLKSIIDSKLYQPKINWQGLWQNFTFSMAQRPTTCFKDIEGLEAAHYLEFNLVSGQISKTKYWDIPTNTQDLNLTKNEATELLETALYKSISYRLKADVEVGTFMSGGIDSTTISAIASKIQPNIKAFTLGFKTKYTDYDEIKQAKETAKLNNLNHIIHYENPNTILDNIDTIITGYEEPYHHLPANYVLANAVAKNKVKVVLNGLGGDELFAGYHFYNKLNKWQTLKRFDTLINILPKNLNNRIEVAKKLVSYKNMAQFYTHFRSTYYDADNLKLFNNQNFNSLNTLETTYPNASGFTDDLEALSYYDLKSYIGNHQTRTVDQFTMNVSIEGRFPFLDHELIELAFKIPSKYKIKNGVQKYILKQVAKKHIAPSCFNMPKKGFGLPLEYWYKNELKSFIIDNTNLLKSRHLFNNQEIDKILKTTNVRKIWHLVMTEQWLQKFFDH